MIYLKTRTESLSTPTLRRVVSETIKWCEQNIGVKPSRKRTFKYKVMTLPSSWSPSYGCYSYERNTLYVFKNHSEDIKLVVRTVLHEYTHYLQNLRSYHKILKKVGYDKHPLEIEARSMEKLYSICWKNIKNNI